jgi:hypothetical protein
VHFSKLRPREAAPCCPWLDELEKGLAGSKSSRAAAGGTSARVCGSSVGHRRERLLFPAHSGHRTCPVRDLVRSDGAQAAETGGVRPMEAHPQGPAFF